jgi:predicted SAM-dependent methyltransferase
MKYLNLGCGSHYSTEKEWTNLDFISSGEGVIAHNLLSGIPFEDNSFDLVYHSHVLEHFSKQDGENFIKECLRVLKPNSILRIAIPDLEQIARLYIKFLEQGLNEPENDMIKANYDWMLIEMYDQTVRNHSGGNMGKYLFQDTIVNEEFVFERIGKEGKDLRNTYLSSKNQNQKPAPKTSLSFGRIISALKRRIKSLIGKSNQTIFENEIGKFRLGGEIHQWMYDRYSLTILLKQKGADKIMIRDAFTSYLDNWSGYNIDGKDNIVRKPDSLFIEAIKK